VLLQSADAHDLTSIGKCGFILATIIYKERSSMAYLQKMTARLWVALGLFATALLVVLPPVLAQQQYDSRIYSGLRWRMIGPFRGGA